VPVYTDYIFLHSSYGRKSDLVVELRQRHLGFYDDDEETEECARERVVGDAFASLRQDVAQSQSEPDVVVRSASGDQLRRDVAVFLRVAAFYDAIRHDRKSLRCPGKLTYS